MSGVVPGVGMEQGVGMGWEGVPGEGMARAAAVGRAGHERGWRSMGGSARLGSVGF